MVHGVIRSRVKQLAVRWPRLLAVLLAIDDLRWGVRLRLKRFRTRSGSAHAELSLDDSIRYIETVFNDYVEFGDLQGRGVAAELGPGDSAGVALLLRLAGYEQIDMIDRYESERDPHQQEQIYAALDARHALGQFRIGERWDARALRGVTYYAGQPAETYFARAAAEGRQYDLIVSRSVMEHLYDPLAALESMVDALKPGGRMIHKVDLRDHAMFTPAHPELTFLTIGDTLYSMMTRNSGRPNRVLLPDYRRTLGRLATEGTIEYEILVTQLVGVGELSRPIRQLDIPPGDLRDAEAEVDRVRPRFSRRFRTMSSSDLAVSGFFLKATRRQAAAVSDR